MKQKYTQLYKIYSAIQGWRKNTKNEINKKNIKIIP